MVCESDEERQLDEGRMFNGLHYYYGYCCCYYYYYYCYCQLYDGDHELVRDLPLDEGHELVQDPQLDVGRCDFYDAVHGQYAEREWYAAHEWYAVHELFSLPQHPKSTDIVNKIYEPDRRKSITY